MRLVNSVLFIMAKNLSITMSIRTQYSADFNVIGFRAKEATRVLPAC